MKSSYKVFIFLLLVTLGFVVSINTASGESGLEVKVDDLFTLGHVNFLFKEDIVWRIIAIEDNKALVVSSAVKTDVPFSQEGEATWEDSYVRQWLNNEFYNTAFTEDERKLISCSEVTTVNSQNDQNVTLLTNDYLFCLSVEEVEQYIPSPGKRNLTRIRDKRKGMDGINYYDVFGQGWWLRNTSYGATNYWHNGVTYISTYRDQSVDYATPQAKMDVCPAFWAEVDSIQKMYRKRAEEARLEEEERQRKAAEKDSPESLMALIENASGEKVVNRYIYDDFDGDGNNELFAFLGFRAAGYYGMLSGEFWFASISSVKKLDMKEKYFWGYEELEDEKLFAVYRERYGEVSDPYYWNVIDGEVFLFDSDERVSKTQEDSDYIDASQWVGKQIESVLPDQFDWDLEDVSGEYGAVSDEDITVYIETKYGYVTSITVYDGGQFCLLGVHIGSGFDEAKRILEEAGWKLTNDVFDEGPNRCDYENINGHVIQLESIEDELVDYMNIYIGDEQYDKIS